MQLSKEQQDVVDRILASTGEISPYLKMCFYGEAGAGKTVFSAAAGDNPLIVEVEKEGTLSLYNHPELISNGRGRIFKMNNVLEVENLVDALLAGALPEHDVVLIDTASELASRNLDEILDYYGDKEKRSNLLAFQKDYKINTSAMRRLLVKLTDLQRHVIITAHHLEEIQKDDKGNVLSTFIRPDFSPKFEKTVRALCSVIGFMWKEDRKESNKTITTRYLRISGTRRVYAKSRIGGLPNVIENPSVEMLFQAFERMLNGSVAKS